MDLLKMPLPLMNRGDRIGDRYRIAGLIGQGGMGVVYAAEDLKLGGMLRAVKLTAAAPDEDRRYSDEAHMLMKLNHPHLPHIIDYMRLEEAGCEALVMDYFHGQTISAYLESSLSGFSYGQIVQICLQLCSALGYLHQQTPPIIHRDLKPSNVMIDSSGQAKLIDFGISRYYKHERLLDTVQLGTVGFAAPEQEGVSQSDARTDIYGLGALLYYMVSGGITYQRERERFTGNPFRYLPADIPKKLMSMMDRMLQHNPKDRYGSMNEISSELMELLQREDLFRSSDLISAQPNRKQVSVLSVTPGSGATFLTVSLAELLSYNSIQVLAVEFSENDPEWHTLLPPIGRSKSKRSFSSETAFDERYLKLDDEENKVCWLALQPRQELHSINAGEKFDQMVRQAGASRLLTLIDLSSKWKSPEAERLLRQSEYVIVTGDPFVHKWQADDIQRLNLLQKELLKRGGSLLWIANKDNRFTGRKEWLSLFPEKPAATIPYLPQGFMLDTIWGGRRVTDDTRVRKRLTQSLKPIISILSRKMVNP